MLSLKRFEGRRGSVPRDMVNLPHAAMVEDVAAIYRQAWKWGLKGVTVFRYGSKGEQVFERNTLPCLLENVLGAIAASRAD